MDENKIVPSISFKELKKKMKLIEEDNDDGWDAWIQLNEFVERVGRRERLRIAKEKKNGRTGGTKRSLLG